MKLPITRLQQAALRLALAELKRPRHEIDWVRVHKIVYRFRIAEAFGYHAK